jgi:hypothetical protein
MAKNSVGRAVPITDSQIAKYNDKISKNEKIINNKKPDKALEDQANRTMVESMAGKRKMIGGLRNLGIGLGVPLIGGLGSWGLYNWSNRLGEKASRGQELMDRINAANR